MHVSVETLCNLFIQASQAYVCGDSSVLSTVAEMLRV